MSRHYFPSVLDDFEQKSTSIEQSEESIPNNTEPVVNAVQINPKYNKCFTVNIKKYTSLRCSLKKYLNKSVQILFKYSNKYLKSNIYSF